MNQETDTATDAELKLLQLKRERLEIDHLQKELQRKGVNWNVVIPFLAAILGLVPPAYIAAINANAQIAAEQLRDETALIVEAVKTPDQQQGFKNLRFFIDSGKLSDPDHRMARLLRSGDGPALPTSSESCPNGLGRIVWTDPESHQYHVAGQAWFGGSRGKGKFMCEVEAQKAGYMLAPGVSYVPHCQNGSIDPTMMVQAAA